MMNHHRGNVQITLVAAVLACIVYVVRSASGFIGKNNPEGQIPSTYTPEKGDISSSTHFAISRQLISNKIKFSLSYGSLRVLRSDDPKQLRISIDSPGADRTLGEYLCKLSTSSDEAVVDIQIPRRYEPSVTLYVPQSVRLKSLFNVGSGTVRMNTSDVLGDRRINLGSGRVVLVTNHGKDYQDLRLVIGSGILVDRRGGGHSSIGVVSRTENANGDGSVLVSVGSGELTLSDD